MLQLVGSDTNCLYKDGCLKRNSDVCGEYCVKKSKLDSLYKNSMLSDKQMVDITLFPDNPAPDGFRVDKDKFDILQNIKENIVSFVRSGNNLYIHSNICGNGKTEWSLKLMRAYINSIWAYANMDRCVALFVNVPRFLLSLKDNIESRNEYVRYVKDHVLEADIVVWDEIGVKELTTYEHEHLLNLINTRLDMGKSNIYTSNLSGNELRLRIGDRLYSRVVRMSTDITFEGYDKRGAIVR